MLTDLNLLEVVLVHNVANIVITATIMLARPKDSVMVSLMETEHCQRTGGIVKDRRASRIFKYLHGVPDRYTELGPH